MSATDELRQMLDERGVEWEAPESYDGSFEHDTIVGDYWFHEYDGKITVHGMTPEQAIAATLGDADATPTRQGVDPMTLAEAISHEEWAATTAHGELAAEHAQMRDWLRELERLRTENAKLRAARDAAVEDAKSIIVMLSNARAENARLRSELESVGTAAYLYGRTDLADENAKLRELARGLGQCAQGVGCEDCLLYDRSEPDHCREERLSRELGVEVNDV